MPTPRRWLQSLIGIGLCTVALVVILILRQNRTFSPPTVQEQPIAIEKVAQATAPDSPLPTAMVEGTIEPTWTPLPTLPPPPTPTVIPGPTPTAWPLITPAPDAAGTILYAATEVEIKPGYDASITIYSISVDKTGQPQGETVRLNGEIQVSGLAAIYPSPDRSRVLIEDGWGVHSILHIESGKVESPFHDSPNPRGIFFGWHPDSKHILIRAEDNHLDPGLWLVNSDTGQHTTLLALYGMPSILNGSSVSPDGQKVVYSLKRDFQVPSELWTANTNGADHRQLHTYDGYIVALSWSPDGSKIAFLGDGLIVMNADGTEIHTFGKDAAIGYNFQPVWAPDSKMLAYVAYEQASASSQEASKDSEYIDPFAATNIHLVNIVTGEERRLLNDDSIGNIDPTWSPDGSQLAFVSKRSGVSAIWLVNADGSNLHELPIMNQWIRFPSWGKHPLLATQQ